MSRPAVVPEELVGVPFRARDAIAAGLITADQLRSRAWARLFRGVYVTAAHVMDENVRLAALRLVLQDDPGAVVCGRTAAWVYGACSPREGTPLPLEITRPVRAPGTATRGLYRRRLVLRGTSDCVVAPTGLSELDEDVIEVDGLRITSPLRTCFDLMRERGLVESTVVADAFAFRTGMPLWMLGAYCSSRRRWPNVRTARQSVLLASAAARSPGETRLRMVVVLAGFDEPLVNVPVVDRIRGEIVAVPDLTVFGRQGRLTGMEYDGAYHEEGDQPVLDRLRQNRLATIGQLPVLRYDAVAVRERRQQIVDDVSRLTRQRPMQELLDADFRRLPPHLAL